MSLTKEESTKVSDFLLELIPKDGSTRGNLSLKNELANKVKKELKCELTEDDYWIIRNDLVDKGTLTTARGKGGAVRRSQPVTPVTPTRKCVDKSEQSLYKPFADFISKYWTKQNALKDFVVEITANQGKRNTGGKWTRPDISVIAIKTFTFTPGRHLEVITFEIKPENQYDVSGVFETASHSIFAHKSYLVFEWPNERPKEGDADYDRLEQLCKEFGIGLMMFSDRNKIEESEIMVEPKRKNPDPSDVDDFIRTQINQDVQNEIHRLLK